MAIWTYLNIEFNEEESHPDYMQFDAGVWCIPIIPAIGD